MAAVNDKKLMGYDPIACLDQEPGNRAMEDVIMTAETVQEQLVACDDDSLSASANDCELLEAESGETDMNMIADLPEDQISDEAAEDIAESIINLDAALTIQHVVTLHEKLKKSYSANNSIEINASQVSSIDTATLQLLVALKKNAVKQQKEVIFAKPSPRFIESAELLGLLEILDIDV
jgi:anti-anti-sigma regulatory factor